MDIPVVALAGSLGPDLTALHEKGLLAAASLVPGPMPAEEAMARAAELMTVAAERMMRWVAVGQRIK